MLFKGNIKVDVLYKLQRTYSIRDQTLRFRYATSLRAEEKQPHVLHKPKTLLKLEIRERGTECCRSEMTSVIWPACTSLPTAVLTTLNPLHLLLTDMERTRSFKKRCTANWMECANQLLFITVSVKLTVSCNVLLQDAWECNKVAPHIPSRHTRGRALVFFCSSAD
jgi:hypothetical protein